MKFLASLLIFCHLFILVQPVLLFAQSNDEFEMEVTLVKQNSLIANKGIAQGVNTGYLYNIVRNGKAIGSAEVMVVRQVMCGLKIIKSTPKLMPRAGDKLILEKKISTEQWSILDEMQQQDFSREKLKNPPDIKHINYFMEGKEAAEKDYGTAFAGGLFAGFMGGLIGWGIGYAIVSSKGADVPAQHLRPLNDREARKDFSAGYIEGIKSKRKRTFNSGALMGTMVAVVFILATANN